MSRVSAYLYRGGNGLSLGHPVWCDGSSFLLSSIDVPAQSQIIEASPKTPLLTMFIKLDMPTVREVVSRDDMLTDNPVPHRQGLAVGETTAGLLGTCLSSARPA